MYLENFCCYESVDLNLENQGLVLVRGANGSGKSTLFKGLCWGLYGKTIDGNSGDEIIGSNGKDAFCSIQLKDDWRIYRERSKGSTSLFLTKNDSAVAGDKKNIQNRIIEILGFDFLTFRNTILFAQNDNARFANPLTRDSDRKNILYEIMNTKILKECHKIVLKKKSEIVEKGTSLFYQLRSANEGIKLSRLNEMIFRKNEWDNEIKEQILLLEKKKKENEIEYEKLISVEPVNITIAKERLIKDELKNIEDKIIELEKDESVFLECKRKIKEQNNMRSVISKREKDYAKILDKLNERRTIIETTKTCPECGKTLDCTETIKNLNKKVNDEIENIKSIMNSLNKDYDDIEDAIENTVIKMAEHSNCPDKIKLEKEKEQEIKRQYYKTISKINLCEDYDENISIIKEKIKKIKNKINPYSELVFEEESLKKQWENKLKKLIKEEEELKENEKMYEFWVNGFSNRGLPSYILDEIIPFVTNRTNYYLGELSNGKITVNFDTQRKLKSKDQYRDEIKIDWTIDNIKNCSPSGGELRKIEISTDLALFDLLESYGVTTNLFIADEILTELDDENVKLGAKLLKYISKKRDSVFIISHKPFISDMFEKSITVIKENGKSSIKYEG
jgi:exonuclease SbcC